MKCRSFHKPDHVRRGINLRQFGMMRGERVLEFNRLLGHAASTHWNGFCHSYLYYLQTVWDKSMP